MTTRGFIIRVEKVKPGCALPIGLSSDILYSPAILGRDPEADFRIQDPTISKQHARVETGEGVTSLVNLSAKGSTFVDGKRLEPGESVPLDRARTWIQLGRVLLRVYDEPPTLPVEEPMAIPTATGAGRLPLLRVQRSGPMIQLWCRGHRVQLFPQAARVLARLAEEPTETVEAHLLMEAADPDSPDKFGGTSLSQLITYVRNMFDEALDAGWVPEEDLTRMVGSVRGGDLPPDDRRELLRALIENVRGVGYRFNVPLDSVQFEV